MMIIEDHQFQAMCKTIDREDLIDDPRCANMLARIMNAEELFGEMETELAKWTTEEIVARARKHGAPVAPANGIKEMMADPQAIHAGIVMDVDHPEAGALRYLKNPARFSATPTSMRTHPPRLGEHNVEILEEAGYSAEEIEALRNAGVLK